MTTHFITAEIDLQESPAKLHQEIEAELEKRGEPLRWAITGVDVDQQKVSVEAVVTKAVISHWSLVIGHWLLVMSRN